MSITKIPVCLPKLPSAEQILPYLKQILLAYAVTQFGRLPSIIFLPELVDPLARKGPHDHNIPCTLLYLLITSTRWPPYTQPVSLHLLLALVDSMPSSNSTIVLKAVTWPQPPRPNICRTKK